MTAHFPRLLQDFQYKSGGVYLVVCREWTTIHFRPKYVISLIHFTYGYCITEIICACFSFIVLITTDGGLGPIDTDPNIFRVDTISFVFALMLYLKDICGELQQQTRYPK
jgi:hypothetical protein